jgi:hypothetical protein
VLVSSVYVVACRLFALVLLLARSDRSKELELLVLRPSSRFCGGRHGVPNWLRATGWCWRR